MTLKRSVEQRLGHRISRERFEEYLHAAKKKQKNIIKRFGALNGERRSKGYLIELLVEVISLDVLSTHTKATAVIYDMEKGALCKQNNSLTTTIL